MQAKKLDKNVIMWYLLESLYEWSNNNETSTQFIQLRLEMF